MAEVAGSGIGRNGMGIARCVKVKFEEYLGEHAEDP